MKFFENYSRTEFAFFRMLADTNLATLEDSRNKYDIQYHASRVRHVAAALRMCLGCVTLLTLFDRPPTQKEEVEYVEEKMKENMGPVGMQLTDTRHRTHLRFFIHTLFAAHRANVHRCTADGGGNHTIHLANILASIAGHQSDCCDRYMIFDAFTPSIYVPYDALSKKGEGEAEDRRKKVRELVLLMTASSSLWLASTWINLYATNAHEKKSPFHKYVCALFVRLQPKTVGRSRCCVTKAICSVSC